MNKLDLISSSCEDTEKIAYIFASFIQRGSFIAMYGDLGSGKTYFSRFLFAQKGFTQGFSSPTFTIIKEYMTQKEKAYHLDVYKIEDIEELEYIGYYDCLQDSVLTVTEWADKIKSELPSDRYDVYFERTGDEKRRIIIQNNNIDLTELGVKLHEYIGH